jgi:hypothetical protein
MGTAYTSTTSGHWNVGTNWTPTGVPGAGDTATIDHAIVIDGTDGNVTIGDGTNSTVLSVVTTASSLTITGAKLTIRGNAMFGAYNSGNIRIYLDIANSGGTGGGVELDGNSSVAPLISFDYDSMLRIKGTSSARCFFRTKSGTAGLPGRISTTGDVRSPWVDAAYADFARLGDATNSGFIASASFMVSLPAGYTAPPFKWDHCTFDSCGQIPAGTVDNSSGNGTADCELTYCKWTNAVAQFCLQLDTGGSALTTGTRKLEHCVFDEVSKPYINVPRDLTVQHNFLGDNWQTNGFSAVWALFTDNFILKTVNEETAPAGSISSCYYLNAPIIETSVNTDWIIPHNTDMTVSKCRKEYIGSRTDNIWIGMSETGTINRTVKVINNVCDYVVTNGFHNPNDVGSPTTFCEHNTVKVGSLGAILQSCNGSPGPLAALEIAGQTSSFRANLCWYPSAGSGFVAATNSGTGDGVTGIVVDALAEANADYNGRWNLSNGPNNHWTVTTPISGATTCTNGTPYDTPMSGSTSPGTHDVSVNPGFVDVNRGVAAFDAHMGGPGTVAHALLALAAQYDSTDSNYVSGYTTAALLAWSLAGFVPTNASLQHASYTTPSSDPIGSDAIGTTYTGTPDIGALAVQPSGGSVTAYTLTGPVTAKGDCGAATGNYTVTLGSGTLAGTAVITPHDSTGDGTFSPTTVSLTDSSRSATFTYTPKLTGARNISTTNSASLTNPSAVSYLSMVALGSSGTAASGNACPKVGGFDWYAAGTWLPEFKRDISGDTVDPQSASWIANFPSTNLHIDFSATGSGGGTGTYGIPINIVPGTQANVSISYTTYSAQSNAGSSVPIPPLGSFEGYNNPGVPPGSPPGSGVDRHLLVGVRNETTGKIDTLYEFYQPYTTDGGTTWIAAGGMKFDILSGDTLPDNQTTAESAGTMITPALLTYERVNLVIQGLLPDLGHCIRCTWRFENRYVWPGRNFANSGSPYPASLPAGARVRLSNTWYQAHKSSYSGQARVILDAMAKYGLINADNGGDFFIGGVTDDNWDPDATGHGIFSLQNVPASAFEVILLKPAWTWSGPSSGPVGVSKTFTITRNPSNDTNYFENVYITANGSGSGVGSSPAALSDNPSNGHPSQTFTFTPPSVGTYTIAGEDGSNDWWNAAPLTFVSLAVNTIFATFTATNGTVVNNGSYTDDSGHTWGAPPWATTPTVVIQSNWPYSGTGGTPGYAISNQAIGQNDPVEMDFLWGGTDEGFGIVWRYQAASNGACYTMTWQASGNSSIGIYWIDSSPTGHNLFNFPKPSMITGHSYVITIAPWYNTHYIFIYDQTASQWYSGRNAAWQSTSDWIFQFGHGAIMTGGRAGFGVAFASGISGAPEITTFSGGPAISISPVLTLVRAADTLVHLYPQALLGGLAPISYSLQRKPSGGSYSTIQSATPGVDAFDSTVAVSSSYVYRLAATDANSITTYSNEVAVTTLASQAWAPYTLKPGSITSVINGTIWEDTDGYPMIIRHHRIRWDQRFGQLLLTSDTSQVHQDGSGLGLYASVDGMIWTYINEVVNIAQLSGHGTFSFINNLSIIPHPTNGFYYSYFCANITGTDNSATFIFRGTSPHLAGSNYVAGPIQVPYVTDSPKCHHVDSNYWIDPATGEVWDFHSLNGTTAVSNHQSGYACQIASTWDGYVLSSSLISPLDGNNEALAPFRPPLGGGRILYCGFSYATAGYWNPNSISVSGDPSSTGDTTTPENQWYQYIGALVFTTGAQSLAAPAGAPQSGFLSSGFGGSLDSSYKTSFHGYGGGDGTVGSVTGIDPVASYSTQVWSVLITATGEVIWCTVRWDASGGNTATYVWLPVAFDSNIIPTIPFASSFIPSTGGGGGGGGGAKNGGAALLAGI